MFQIRTVDLNETYILCNIHTYIRSCLWENW